MVSWSLGVHKKCFKKALYFKGDYVSLQGSFYLNENCQFYFIVYAVKKSIILILYDK